MTEWIVVLSAVLGIGGASFLGFRLGQDRVRVEWQADTIRRDKDHADALDRIIADLKTQRAENDMLEVKNHELTKRDADLSGRLSASLLRYERLNHQPVPAATPATAGTPSPAPESGEVAGVAGLVGQALAACRADATELGLFLQWASDNGE